MAEAILVRLAKGWSNQEIAGGVVISERSVGALYTLRTDLTNVTLEELGQ